MLANSKLSASTLQAVGTAGQTALIFYGKYSDEAFGQRPKIVRHPKSYRLTNKYLLINFNFTNETIIISSNPFSCR